MTDQAEQMVINSKSDTDWLLLWLIGYPMFDPNVTPHKNVVGYILPSETFHVGTK